MQRRYTLNPKLVYDLVPQLKWAVYCASDSAQINRNIEIIHN